MSERVTLRDIQDAIQRLEDKVGKKLDDHEQRIRVNESFRYKLYGIAAIVGFLIGLIADYIRDTI